MDMEEEEGCGKQSMEEEEGCGEQGMDEEEEESGEKAGLIRRIRVENFMCHSNLTIDLSEHVNFITGQNGSGKSALLTALCVAFGIKAKGTQRANTLKDFIKTGSSYALVAVEMKNEGEDAFRHDVYGDTICVERRITSSGTSTFAIKDYRGRKVATKWDEVVSLVEHFNIEVQNPCVIMTQDKSKEFLHNGTAKDKFKFFFKSTLLQQVSEVLTQISEKLESVSGTVVELEKGLEPLNLSLQQLADRIEKRLEMEGLTSAIEEMQKKLAWALVSDAEKKYEDQLENLERFRSRIPTCQKLIDDCKAELERCREAHVESMARITAMMENAQSMGQEQELVAREYEEAARKVASIEEGSAVRRRAIDKIKENIRALQGVAAELQARFARDTQAEMEAGRVEMERVRADVDAAKAEIEAAAQLEQDLQNELTSAAEAVRSIVHELEEKQRTVRDLDACIVRLQRAQTNTVTAFGGENILNVLRAIEQRLQDFSRPPIGPIGAHVSLSGDNSWSLAVEAAVGVLLNAFVVHNHQDLLVLRRISTDCRCKLTIMIYDFDRPLLSLPQHMLPDPNLTTVMSVINTDNATVMNVLVDQGSVERQVLAENYDAAKAIAFSRGRTNVKEVFTKDGMKLFLRRGVETSLPKDRNIRSGRLGVRIDEEIERTRREIAEAREVIGSTQQRKRAAENSRAQLEAEKNRVKRSRVEIQHRLSEKESFLQELQAIANSQIADANEPNTEEIEQDIREAEAEVEGKEAELQKMQVQLQVAHSNCAQVKSNLDAIRASADEKSAIVHEAEQEVLARMSKVKEAEGKVAHYERVMQNRVLADIREAEEKAAKFKELQEEQRAKAGQVCARKDASLDDGETPETLQVELRGLLAKQRVQGASTDDCPVEDLKMQALKLHKKINKRGAVYRGIKKKLEMIRTALETRYQYFGRNCLYLKRQLHWNFNCHLRKTGCTGRAKVDYENETLELCVTLPQDSSHSAVRDTRALSGGERSFSTLAFALALHQMTESPFRAMDEFDVFMDDVKRKISLATVVDFAVNQGSQWIFITPHDISSVEAGPKVKKQQMANPRP